MSQRNPLNERYQNADEKPVGKTRKSAASAKPVTKAASSVRIPGKVEEPKGLFARATAKANKSQAVKDNKKKQASKETVERRKEQALRSKYYSPDTPEYKKWKKVWWGMLGAALVSTVISFYLSGRGDDYVNVSFVFIGLSYVLLLLAIIFDFTYLRRLRNEYQDRMIAFEKSKKKSAIRKEEAAAARKAAKEAEENPEPEEERKLFRGLFTRKRASDAVASAKYAQARAAGLTPEQEADAAKKGDVSKEAADSATATEAKEAAPAETVTEAKKAAHAS
ncbi:MAG: hypothetical protein IJ113_08665 [Eggerthellaceae bacterium]|nr:hypothetical protein [Eggerthellaceae bacterium]